MALLTLPGDMRTLIEEYDTASRRLYQIANYFGANGSGGLDFAYDVSSVSIKALLGDPELVRPGAPTFGGLA